MQSIHFDSRANKTIKHCPIKVEGRLYTIGNIEFESLVELVHYFQSHPLYRKVKLCSAISEDTIARLAMVRHLKHINPTRDFQWYLF